MHHKRQQVQQTQRDAAPAAPAAPPDARSVRRRRRGRGQSLLEFAIIAPALLAMMGMCIDVARLYQGWINLESATRDAAQYLATSSNDPEDDNYGATECGAKASFILNTATGTPFTVGTTTCTATFTAPTTCTSASVLTSYTQTTSKTAGGSEAYPVATARVSTCLPFRMLFAYPFLTTDGNFILRSDRTYTIVVGR